MALITIKDLPQSDELDRETMQSISGGADRGDRPAPIDQVMAGKGVAEGGQYDGGVGRIGGPYW